MRGRRVARVPHPTSAFPAGPTQLVGGWATFTGNSTPATLVSEYNVSSLTDNAVGDYTVNWRAPFRDALYAVATCGHGINGGFACNSGGLSFFSTGSNITAGAVRVAGASEYVNTVGSDIVNGSVIAIGQDLPGPTGLNARPIRPEEGVAGYWLNATVSGGTPSIAGHLNVSSITDNGVGDFTINFITALTSAEYFVSNVAQVVGTATVFQHAGITNGTAPTTTAVRILLTDYFDGVGDSPLWTSVGFLTS